MHGFLRNIGFSKVETEEQLSRLLDTLQEKYMGSAVTSVKAGGERMVTIRAEIAKNVGICIRGCYFLDGNFHRTYYYPYVYNDVCCAKDPAIPFETRNGGYYLSFIADDVTQGEIWFIADNVEDLGKWIETQAPDMIPGANVAFAGFSEYATVILPVKESRKIPFVKNDRSMQDEENASTDPDVRKETSVLETLSTDLSRMFTASKRMTREDVYSVIEGNFIPRGVETVDYEVTGEILRFEETENVMTGEKLYIFHIGFKSYNFAIAINAEDVHGEPAVGRRLKCPIWLSARLYPPQTGPVEKTGE